MSDIENQVEALRDGAEVALDATLELGAENQRLRERVAELERETGYSDQRLVDIYDRAAKAIAERDAALAQVAVLRGALEGVGHWSEEEQATCWCGIPSMIPYRGHDGGCEAARAALASTPAPTRAEAEAWLRAGEPVRGALAVPAEPDYSGLCSAPSCEGHCGYVHARGCEAVREYLADHGGDPYRAPSPPDILRRVAERARERIAALAYDAGRPDLCARVRAIDLNVLLDGGE